jgi:hypothetical protein
LRGVAGSWLPDGSGREGDRDHLQRSHKYARQGFGENLGWMGEKQMWLEPNLLILAAVLVLIATQASSMN